MKYIACVIISLLTLKHTFSQNHFNNLYGDFDLSEFGDEIHLFNDYIIAITEANPRNFSSHILIRKISQNGNLISENIIENDSLALTIFSPGSKSLIKDSILYFISTRSEYL